jgi:hypothetical protein
MDTKEWESHQERKERRPLDQTQPVRRLYPEPKKDRREPKEKKR